MNQKLRTYGVATCVRRWLRARVAQPFLRDLADEGFLSDYQIEILPMPRTEPPDA